MNKEDYVSLEVAKLLKEKGFDEYCRNTYSEYGNNITIASVFTRKNTELNNNCYSCPTLYEAQKWLREEHHIHVCVDCNVYGWYSTLFNAGDGEPILQINGCKEHYEEALNNGINNALKFI